MGIHELLVKAARSREAVSNKQLNKTSTTTKFENSDQHKFKREDPK